jgi:transposase
MLRMDQVHVIRHKVLREGMSIRAVARQLGVSRNTVTKYLNISEPCRQERFPRPRPVLEVVAPRLDQLLKEWQDRTTAKQRLTGSRLHRQLVEEGYQVGITTVRDYLREKRRQGAEVYIPLVHRPGEEGQVDFFQVTVEEAGWRQEVWKFLLHLPYSGRGFTWLYYRCDQLSFLDGHVRAAEYLGGLPRRLAYDNLTAAVKRLVGCHRELTQQFLALSSHYLFEPCFTRPGEGHDKGSVEARGKGVRLQHLTPIPQGKTLKEMAAALLQEVEAGWRTQVRRDGREPLALWEEERQGLLPLPERPFEAQRLVLTSASRKATVQVEGGLYSVPSTWAGLDVAAHVGVEDIRLVCRGEAQVVPRERPGGKRIQYRHYLPELARKPQAVRQVAPELVAELGEPFGQLWSLLEARYGSGEAARVLARIIGAVVDHGEAAVAQALRATFQAGRQDLLALPRWVSEEPREVPVPQALKGYAVEAARAADYDALLLGGVR